MKRLSTTGAALVLAAAVLGGTAALAGDRGRMGVQEPATGVPPYGQLTAAGGALGEGEIRRLLSGRTAHIERPRGSRTIIIDLIFGADGSVQHRCRVQHVNVGTHDTPQCRTPSVSGTWTVAGRRLCIIMRDKRCYRVVRAGGGYVFRSPTGKGRPYAGRISIR